MQDRKRTKFHLTIASSTEATPQGGAGLLIAEGLLASWNCTAGPATATRGCGVRHPHPMYPTASPSSKHREARWQHNLVRSAWKRHLRSSPAQHLLQAHAAAAGKPPPSFKTQLGVIFTARNATVDYWKVLSACSTSFHFLFPTRTSCSYKAQTLFYIFNKLDVCQRCEGKENPCFPGFMYYGKYLKEKTYFDLISGF